MKRLVAAGLFLAFAISTLSAQTGLVASHSPTVSKAANANVPAAVTPAGDLKKTIARVNGVAITERDVQEQMRRLFPYYSIHGGRVPEKYQAEIRDKALNQLIFDELTFQEANRRGFKVPETTLKSVIRQARQRFNSQASYQEFAAAQYGSVQEFERRIRRATVIAQFQHEQIELKAKVSDVKLRQYYDQNKKIFFRPESVHLQTITVQVPNNPSEDQEAMARKRIEEILPEAAKSKDYNAFGLLAERVSEDDYRVNMGDRKWLHVVGLPPEVAKAIANVKAGQITSIVAVQNGFAIIRVNDRRPGKQMEFAEVRDDLRRKLEEALRNDNYQQLAQALRKKAKIEIL